MRRDVEVHLLFLTAAQGGRSSPVWTGYRPQLFYDGHDWDAQHEYPDVAQVNPGDPARAFLSLLHPESHLGRLVPGKEIEIREGARVVARGEVTRLLDLPQAAHRERLRAPVEAYYRTLMRHADEEPVGVARDRYWLHVLDAKRVHDLLAHAPDLPSVLTEIDRIRVAVAEYPFLGDRASETRTACDAVTLAAEKAG